MKLQEYERHCSDLQHQLLCKEEKLSQLQKAQTTSQVEMDQLRIGQKMIESCTQLQCVHCQEKVTPHLFYQHLLTQHRYQVNQSCLISYTQRSIPSIDLCESIESEATTVVRQIDDLYNELKPSSITTIETQQTRNFDRPPLSSKRSLVSPKNLVPKLDLHKVKSPLV